MGQTVYKGGIDSTRGWIDSMYTSVGKDSILGKNRQFIRATDILLGGGDRQHMRRGHTVYKGEQTL